MVKLISVCLNPPITGYVQNDLKLRRMNYILGIEDFLKVFIFYFINATLIIRFCYQEVWPAES